MKRSNAFDYFFYAFLSLILIGGAGPAFARETEGTSAPKPDSYTSTRPRPEMRVIQGGAGPAFAHETRGTSAVKPKSYTTTRPRPDLRVIQGGARKEAEEAAKTGTSKAVEALLQKCPWLEPVVSTSVRWGLRGLGAIAGVALGPGVLCEGEDEAFRKARVGLSIPIGEDGSYEKLFHFINQRSLAQQRGRSADPYAVMNSATSPVASTLPEKHDGANAKRERKGKPYREVHSYIRVVVTGVNHEGGNAYIRSLTAAHEVPRAVSLERIRARDVQVGQILMAHLRVELTRTASEPDYRILEETFFRPSSREPIRMDLNSPTLTRPYPASAYERLLRAKSRLAELVLAPENDLVLDRNYENAADESLRAQAEYLAELEVLYREQGYTPDERALLERFRRMATPPAPQDLESMDEEYAEFMSDATLRALLFHRTILELGNEEFAWLNRLREWGLDHPEIAALFMEHVVSDLPNPEPGRKDPEDRLRESFKVLAHNAQVFFESGFFNGDNEARRRELRSARLRPSPGHVSQTNPRTIEKALDSLESP